MNKSPLTKKQIVNLFKKQKVVIFNSEKVNLEILRVDFFTKI